MTAAEPSTTAEPLAVLKPQSLVGADSIEPPTVSGAFAVPNLKPDRLFQFSGVDCV
jgi:hypothetical protein